MARPSPYSAHVDLIENEGEGKFVQTRKINYTDAAGKSRVWEMAIRPTRTETTGIDAVSIAAILKEAGGKKSVLVTKQFRPPTEKVVLEFPAGLIDPNESVESTAVRELLEETGYVGTFSHLLHKEMPLFSDPGLTNANMALAFVDVDMGDERNQSPVPQLEDGEYIDVVKVPLRGMLEELRKMCTSEGCVIDARLYHFAEGLAIGEATK